MTDDFVHKILSATNFNHKHGHVHQSHVQPRHTCADQQAEEHRWLMDAHSKSLAIDWKPWLDFVHKLNMRPEKLAYIMLYDVL